MTTMRWGLLVWACLALGCSSDSDDGGGSAGTGGSGGTSSAGGTGGLRSQIDCDTYCEALVVPRCPDGAQTLDECRPLCGQLLALDCPELDPFLECSGATPSFVCDDRGSPIVQGCESEMEAVGACFSSIND